MRVPGFSLLKVVGMFVVLMGIAALAIVSAPYVYGQSVTHAPMSELRTQLLGGSYIGVTVRDADAADVDRAKLPQPTGAVVEEVRADSPAATAGLQAGDVITKFDGERVRSARQFERLVSDTPDGRQVEMTVVRAGRDMTMKLAPEAAPSIVALDSLRGLRNLELRSLPDLHDLEVRLPENLNLVMPRIDTDNMRILISRGRLGVGVQEMTDQLAEYFGAGDGVLVTTVDDDTPAQAAGIRAGDVITKVNGETVRTAAELRRRLDRASGEVEVTVVRDHREQTLKATLSDRGSVRRIIR